MGDCHFVPLSSYNWNLGAFDLLPWNPTVYCLTAGFFAVSFWLTIDLTLQVYFTFKKHKGLYFWSILAASWGVSLHAVGMILKLFVPTSQAVTMFGTVLAKLGWILDSTGFSVVLYSRLNLVVQNRRILRLVLFQIIIDAFLFHTPIITLLLGIATGRHNDWQARVFPWECFQVIGFTIQETLISGTYVWFTANFLKSSFSNQLRKTIGLLIAVQLVVVLIDVVMAVIDIGFQMFTLKAIMHPFQYALKLKIEFAVLNLLLASVKPGRSTADFLQASSGESSPDAGSAVVPQGRRRSSIFSAFLPGSYRTKSLSEESSLPGGNSGISKVTELDRSWRERSKHDIEPSSEVIIASRPPEPVYSAPGLARLDSGDTLQGESWGKDEEKSIDDVERQYLGRFGLNRL